MLQNSAAYRLLQLLLVEFWMTQSRAHSICFDFTVKWQSSPGQPWCEIQGSVDQKPFLQYDSYSNKVKPLGYLGEKVNATKAWTELTHMLKEVGQELRMILPDIKVEKTRNRGPPTLQTKLSCQHESGACIGASWQFGFNGQTALLLDTMNMNWTVTDARARGIQKDWENNRNLAENFKKISRGDCCYLLKELLEHWGAMLEPTAPLLKAPDTQQSSLIQSIVWIFSTIICSGLIFIVKRVLRKSATMEG